MMKRKPMNMCMEYVISTGVRAHRRVKKLLIETANPMMVLWSW